MISTPTIADLIAELPRAVKVAALDFKLEKWTLHAACGATVGRVLFCGTSDPNSGGFSDR